MAGRAILILAAVILFGVSGGDILAAMDREIGWYMVSLGSILIADAGVRMIQIARSAKEDMNAGKV
ncbi:MAG: hypothetical protein MR580_02050 [Anaerolactibacter massiliensis]|nr:hypothetical protein [Anaerolactibacter massiliensis]MDY3234042.1 hypothetical protein [Erysipelotrichaceae bacterium]